MTFLAAISPGNSRTQAALDWVTPMDSQVLRSGVKFSPPRGRPPSALIKDGSSRGAPHGVARLKRWRKIVALRAGP